MSRTLPGLFRCSRTCTPRRPSADAAQACGLRWADFGSTLGQNETLYLAARALTPTDPIDREFRKQLLEAFEDAGVALPADKRARAKQLSDRIVDLGQQFDQRIRDAAIKVPFTAAELAGVADTVWKDKPRDAQGRYLLGLDYPTYLPVLERADQGATRERMWHAKQDEGGDANLKLLGEISQLRREYAQLFDLKSYADFQLRRRMSESTAKTQAFLASVRAAVTEREVRDIDELRAAKAAQLGTPLAATRLERWDISYYTERVRRERYSVDQEAFRQYFPPQESLQFVMRIAEKMLGIRYTRVPAVLWHPDVQAYAVSDAKTGKPLSTLYVDLYPRRGQVQPCRGLGHPWRLDPHRPCTAGRPCRQHGQEGPDPRRAGDLAARVGPWPARQPVGHPLRLAGRHQRAARFRRGTIADARGLGLRQAGAQALRRGLPDLQAGARRDDRQGPHGA